VPCRLHPAVFGKEESIYDLASKVTISTGVGRHHGIGRATALRLAQEGARPVLADLGRAMLQADRDVIGMAPDREVMM
jgi:NAD(P)-dependent dehydrogenase (short-subunit alcohol dehydrogenase family)